MQLILVQPWNFADPTFWGLYFNNRKAHEPLTWKTKYFYFTLDITIWKLFWSRHYKWMSPLLFLRRNVPILFLKKKISFLYCFIQNTTLNSTQNRGMISECRAVRLVFSLRTRSHTGKGLHFSHSLCAIGFQLQVQLQGLHLKLCTNYSELQWAKLTAVNIRCAKQNLIVQPCNSLCNSPPEHQIIISLF